MMNKVMMVVVGMMLSGCTIFGDAAPDTRSVALRVALHTGITDEDKGPIKDIPRARIEQALAGQSEGEMNRLSKSEAPLRYAPNFLYLASSNKRAEAIVVGLIAEMILPGYGTREHPATKPHLIAYIPQELADGDEDIAYELMNKTLTNGVAQVLSREYRVRRVEVVEKRTFKSDIKKTFLALTGGPICGTKVMCSVEPWAVDDILEEDDAPEIVPPSEDGYFAWKNWKPGDSGMKNTATMIASVRFQPLGSQVGDTKTYFTGAEFENWHAQEVIYSRDYLRDLTAVMPVWFYVYVGVDGPTLPPAIFHRGQQLDFIGS